MQKTLADWLETLSQLIQNKQFQSALPLCLEALAQFPQAPELQVMLGYVQLEQGDGSAAEVAFLRARQQAPERPEICAFLARLAREQERWLQAADYEYTYVEQMPDDRTAWFRLGEDYTQLKRPERAAVCFLRSVDGLADETAETALKRALQILPGQPDLQTRLVRLYLSRKDRLALQALMAPGLPNPPPFNPDEMELDTVQVYPYEVTHQLAQLRYLLQQRLLPASYARLESHWQQAEAALNQREPFEPFTLRCPGARWLKCGFYEYPLPNFPRLLHPELDTTAIEAAFLEADSGPTVIEPLLAPAVLEQFYQYLLCSTLWHQPYPTGYLGCSWRTGFYPQLLFQLADELAHCLPRIFAPHPLRNYWAFRSDWRSLRPGIHGDQAAINLNLWLTPPEANQDPDSGGLLVYDTPVPADWDFAYYNQPERLPELQTFLQARQAPVYRIPYRQNRAVIFRSDRLHEVDHLRFRPGFLNMRTTLVMLFGER